MPLHLFGNIQKEMVASSVFNPCGTRVGRRLFQGHDPTSSWPDSFSLVYYNSKQRWAISGAAATEKITAGRCEVLAQLHCYAPWHALGGVEISGPRLEYIGETETFKNTGRGTASNWVEEREGSAFADSAAKGGKDSKWERISRPSTA
jgi:hypothetical protein